MVEIISKPKISVSDSLERIDHNGSFRDVNSGSTDLQYPPESAYSEARLSDDESPDDSMKTECSSLGSEEEPEEPRHSDYDSPHTLIDMGAGDMAIGYSERRVK